MDDPTNQKNKMPTLCAMKERPVYDSESLTGPSPGTHFRIGVYWHVLHVPT